MILKLTLLSALIKMLDPFTEVNVVSGTILPVTLLEDDIVVRFGVDAVSF